MPPLASKHIRNPAFLWVMHAGVSIARNNKALEEGFVVCKESDDDLLFLRPSRWDLTFATLKQYAAKQDIAAQTNLQVMS
jgi:hypothetical protein